MMLTSSRGFFSSFLPGIQFEFQIIAFKETLFCILSSLLVDLAKRFGLCKLVHSRP